MSIRRRMFDTQVAPGTKLSGQPEEALRAVSEAEP